MSALDYPSWSFSGVIRHHECDPKRHEVKIRTLFDLLQTAAACHADELNFGMDALAARGQLWVLSRLKLRIKRALKLGESFTVETRPSGVHRLFALRQYVIRDQEGNDAVHSSSEWLLLRRDTYRPIPPSPIFAPGMLEAMNPEVFFPDLGKLPEHEIAERPIRFPVRHSGIDVNGHLNNALYAMNAADAVAALIDSYPAFEELQINFNHAAMLGEVVCSGAVKTPEGTYYADGRSSDGAKLYYQALFRLQE
ncbi:MAG: thioesterase [Victivallaceae bacterium]|nr:thioesterase [Victivallaceae bacterium]